MCLDDCFRSRDYSRPLGGECSSLASQKSLISQNCVNGVLVKCSDVGASIACCVVEQPDYFSWHRNWYEFFLSF